MPEYSQADGYIDKARYNNGHQKQNDNQYGFLHVPILHNDNVLVAMVLMQAYQGVRTVPAVKFSFFEKVDHSKQQALV